MKQNTFLADNLKTLRHFQKMTTASFARKIGVDTKRLAEVEKGRLKPTKEEIQAILSEFSPMTKEQLLTSRFELSMSEFSNQNIKNTEYFTKEQMFTVMNMAYHHGIAGAGIDAKTKNKILNQLKEYTNG